ncbi:MAG: hypothetical protein HC808_18235, partial [Candidatus Competibacteraceae bacterium]|nr:hypothetical protein [Candidatus Competibacteraceae bacterium]
MAAELERDPFRYHHWQLPDETEGYKNHTGDQRRIGTVVVTASRVPRRLGIDYAVHVKRGEKLGLTLARLPMRDFDPADQRLRLPDAVRTLHELLCDGHRVYVHCTAGINRSSLVVLAYFIFVESQSEDIAMATIQLRRPEAAPYWDALHACHQDLLEQHQDALRERAEDLSRQSLYPDAHSVRLQAERAIIR